MLAQAPHQGSKSILSKEGLTTEYEGWHTPVSSRPQRRVVRGQRRFVTLGLSDDGAVHFGEVDPGALGGTGEVIAFVPVVHRTAPEDARDFVTEG